MEPKKVFVTVGTTKFDKLINTVSSTTILDTLQKLGYVSIQFQTGTGQIPEKTHETLHLKYDKYFENFETEIEKANLVISHAGAGTCLEVLKNQKPLIVVINEDLMDNHQTELASQLEDDGYLYYCTCDTLGDTLLNKPLANLKLYPKPSPMLFSNYLDRCMGFV